VKYMLMICVDPADVPEDEPGDVEPWVNDLDARGIRLFGDRLRPPSDATTVKVRRGEVLASAARHPMAAYGMVEVRPFWPFD
jgi:hypothetical protein